MKTLYRLSTPIHPGNDSRESQSFSVSRDDEAPALTINSPSDRTILHGQDQKTAEIKARPKRMLRYPLIIDMFLSGQTEHFHISSGFRKAIMKLRLRSKIKPVILPKRKSIFAGSPNQSQ